jgi:hypothetical protein
LISAFHLGNGDTGVQPKVHQAAPAQPKKVKARRSVMAAMTT